MFSRCLSDRSATKTLHPARVVLNKRSRPIKYAAHDLIVPWSARAASSPSIQKACVNAGSFLDKTAYHADGIQKAHCTVEGINIAIHMWRDFTIELIMTCWLRYDLCDSALPSLDDNVEP